MIQGSPLIVTPLGTPVTVNMSEVSLYPTVFRIGGKKNVTISRVSL